MGLFWKAVGFALIALLLGLCLEKGEFALVLTAAACAMVAYAGATFLEPVLTLAGELAELGQLDMLDTLLRCVGVGLVAQLAGMVCADAGNTALGRQVQLMGSAAVLYLSLSILTGLLSLIQEILGEL